KDIRKHLTICFAVMGVPAKIKTDNGPGYRSSALATFLQQWGVTHDFSVPYNSTGQAIIKRTHRT
ncbi:POK8 protein, partial [Pterocles burchelli]|nr:POK8 protein [Pterocles burchelli]